MAVVYKYYLLGPVTPIDLPAYPFILQAGIQGDMIVIWALVEPDNKPERYEFRAVNTGQPLEGLNLRYLNTVTTSNEIVWHVFYRRCG